MNRLGGSISRMRKQQATHPPSPYRRKGEIVFTLGAYKKDRSSDIMMSTKLLTKYSDLIIKSCKPIVRVSFNLLATDWVRSFSLIDDEYTREDECVKNPHMDLRHAKWGQQGCI